MLIYFAIDEIPNFQEESNKNQKEKTLKISQVVAMCDLQYLIID